MSRSRYRIYDDAYPHFLTCTVVGWLPVFTRPSCVEIVLDSWRFLQRAGRLRLFGYVILENHFHFIAAAERLAQEVGDFKSFTARKVIDFLQERGERTLLRQLDAEMDPRRVDRDHQLWQEGSHPQQIISDEMMAQKLEYIHANPVKRGYVEESIHWRYSSARNYAGLSALLPVLTDWWNAPPPALGFPTDSPGE
jgi:putative transposase